MRRPAGNSQPEMSAASPTEKLRRGWIFLLLRWAAAFAILALLFHFFPMAQLRDALSRVPLTRFLAVLLIYLVALTGGITKWHVVVNSAGAQLNFAASAQCYTSGLFGALFRGHHGKCRGPFSRCGRAAHAGFTRVYFASWIFAGGASSSGAPFAFCRRRGCGNSSFARFDFAPAAPARPLDSFPAQTRADPSRDSFHLASSASPALWLAARHFRAGHVYCVDRASGHLLRTGSAVTRVALRVAAGKNGRSAADHARGNWSPRSGSGGIARAVWSAGGAGAGHGHRVGRRDHRGRPSGRIDSAALAPRCVWPTSLLGRTRIWKYTPEMKDALRLETSGARARNQTCPVP